MLKKIPAILLILCFLLGILSGCDTASVLDDAASELIRDYTAPPDPDEDDVLKNLDLILDNYVSGLKIPDPNDITMNVIDPGDQDDLFQQVDDECDTVEEMAAVIVKALTDTEPSVNFYIKSSVFSKDVLYDVVFNQICGTYMLETMGMQKYQFTTMNAGIDRIAVCLEFFYFDNKYTIDQVKDMKQQSLDKANEIIDDLGLKNMSEYDCVYAVNRYLSDNCVYPDTKPYTDESHSIYGCLIEESAVCEGYARTAQLIFDLVGVDSYYVVGDTPAGGHAWNLVKVDGQYYQLDITWNDTEYQPDGYFLVTDDYMLKSRTWNRSDYPASATTPYK